MKKSHKLIALATIVLSALVFTSCQEAVFANIMKDVAEETGTMNGNITSIARYQVDGKEFLVAPANGGIRYKNAEGSEHGQWKTYSSLPFELHSYSYYEASNHQGQRILKILADSEYLYIVSVAETKNTYLGTSIPASYSIYSKKITLESDGTWSTSGGWSCLTSDNKRNDGAELLQAFLKNDYYYTRFNVFSTNAVKNENRRVFIRSGSGKSSDTDSSTVYEYYEITGNTLTLLTESDISSKEELSSLGYTDRIILDSSSTDLSTIKIDSVTNIKDKFYFLTSVAVTNNETADKDATCFFYGGNATEYLYYYDGTTVSVKQTTDSNGNATVAARSILSSGEPISCFALCNDALIIGRANYYSKTTYSQSGGGVIKIELEDGCLPSSILNDSTKNASKISFSTNAESQLSSSYLIYTLLNVDPSKDELDSCIYSTIGYMGTGASTSVSAKSVGMWSYYPSRGNWNRE